MNTVPRVLALVVVGTFSVAAFAQITSTSFSGGPNGNYTARVTFQPPRVLGPAVQGAPYSADQVSEHTQTLADGTHIRQNQRMEHLFRDSAGRTRTERPWPVFMGPNTPNMPQDVTIVEIVDPLAGAHYILDPDNHVAHRYAVQSRPPMIARPPATGNDAARTTSSATVAIGGSSGSVTKTPVDAVSTSVAVGGGVGYGTAGTAVRMQPPKMESLGTQMIEGVMAEGTRWTTVFPENSVGNDRAFSTIRESWMSPDLKTTVLTKMDDPRSGESVTRLININRSEPDASLFMPPPGYQIVDETEAVTITFKRP